MPMSKSEAGKLGFIASKDTIKKLKQQRMVEYNSVPNFCKQCETPLDYVNKRNKFCSRSCAATFNNLKKESKYKNKCLCCEKNIEDDRPRKYCSKKCEGEYKQKVLYYKLRNNNKIVSKQSKTLRNLLIKFEGNICSVCKITEWNNQPLNMELDHIDGNSEDNRYENIRLICPNCHAQTPTYKAKNKGNGRAYRRQRYAEGKSY